MATQEIAVSDTRVPEVAPGLEALYGTPVDELDEDQRRAEVARLDEELTQEAADLNAGLCRWLAKLARFDELEGWHDHGASSPQKWLSWRCGVSGPLATNYVNVARALPERPHVTRSFASGALSFSKARAICSVATDATEEMLVEWADSTTATEMDTIARTYRRLQAGGEPEQVQRERDERFLEHFFAADGDLRLRGRLPAEEGALLVKALEVVHEDERRDAAGSKDKDDRSWAQKDADALVTLAERALAWRASEGGDPERYLAVLNIDLDVLTSDQPDGVCDIEGLTGLHPETARRLTCDCSIVSLLNYKDGTTFDQGRKTRIISRRMRRALKARDKTCRWPDCERRICDAHHMRHWTRGGPTNLADLRLYCRRHHICLHEGGYTIQVRDGAEVLVNRWGVEVTSTPSQPSERDISEVNSELGLGIDPATIVPSTYYGDPLQLGLLTDILRQQDEPKEERAGPAP